MSSAEAHEVLDDTNRPLANFTPSIWGDYFISYASNSMEMDDPRVVETIMELKNKVKKIFDTDVVENSRKMLGLVDAIQRLGVAIHFEKEIEATLEKIHNNIILDEHCDDSNNNDLYTVSLCFRLLRQQGYNVSCDMFMKFKDSEGKFRESLAEDIQAILSLYEASHLRGHGEEILDEAFIFTTTHLKSLPSSLSPPELLEQVNHSLKHPIRKSIQRREARRYLSVYEQDDSHDEALLSLAKLDFNQLQQLYKKELCELTRWWRELDHSREKLLGFSRDRVVECFYWSLGVFPEAKYSLIRIIYAKQIAVASIVDDIYDSFGTLDELELFTEAFERWDISSIHKLPDYMKLIYKEILDSNDEVEEKLGKGRRSYCFKEACLKLFRAYFQEAKWMHKKEIPTMDEYLRNACNSSGSFPLIVLALLGMGDVVTQDSLDWVLTDPKIVGAFSVFLRFKNDIGHHKIEQRRSGNTVPTTVECYMKQYGTTEEEAIYELTKKFHELWKDVNEECLKPAIPRPLILRVLELVRLVDDIYTDGDAFTKDDLLKDRINSLIINPVPV